MENLSLDKLFTERRPIYVRNNKQGIIALKASEENGRPVLILLPRTKHPLNLSDRFTRYSLENSQSLREAINVNGSLQLVSEEEALAELAKPNVRRELDAAMNKVKRTSTEVQNYRSKGQTAQTHNQAPLAASPGDVNEKLQNFDARAPIEMTAAEEEMDDAPADSNVSARVMSICALVVAGDMTPGDGVDEFENTLMENLSDEDIDYIVNNSNEGDKLNIWASKLLAERRGRVVPAELA